MKNERLGRILAGLGRVLRESATSDTWLSRFASELGEMDGVQFRKHAASVIRGIADQCDEKADLVFPLDKPRRRRRA